VCLPYNVQWRRGYAAAEFCALWAARGTALGMSAWGPTVVPLEWLSWGGFIRDRICVLPHLVRSAFTLFRGVIVARRGPAAMDPAAPAVRAGEMPS